jgi:hypothetical protein
VTAIVTPQGVEVELTERNLRTLLAKLEDPTSQRTLWKVLRTGEVLVVRAVPDDAHYADREPGAVHPAHDPALP